MDRLIKRVFKLELPWFIVHRINKYRNSLLYFINRIYHSFLKTSSRKPKIQFICGFHGNTGGTIAIASIANLLSNQFTVSFFTWPSSNYNEKLNRNILLKNKISNTADIYICDISCKHDVMKMLKNKGHPIIVSCHGFLDELHGLDTSYVAETISLADKVHFVNPVQQDSFKLRTKDFFIIPNTTKPITKSTSTQNAGTVGNLDHPRKGAASSVEIALLSNVNQIHLWSANKDHWKHPRVKIHNWVNDKSKIYASFDILIFFSKQETFGLVVIEAISAGIPCLLSRIPAFEQFEKCPGVVLTDSDDPLVNARIVDDLLANREHYAPKMRAFFDREFSEKAVFKKWEYQIDRLINCN